MINDTLRFNIDRFSETFNKHLNKTTLHVSAEDEINENIPVTSLSRVAKTIAEEGLQSVKIMTNEDLILWQSADYVLDDANLSLQKRNVMVTEEDTIEKDVIVSSLSFSIETPVVETETEVE
jgi:hypothetical protein